MEFALSVMVTLAPASFVGSVEVEAATPLSARPLSPKIVRMAPADVDPTSRLAPLT
ncbi:MAG: hypothetical protein NTW28_33105 [Candidatus Solibacter sp.]|nr:hypothetical protein [Candidatus Solibacter sp.]